MGWELHVARVREMRNAYKILVAKPEGERPLADQEVARRTWEDNVQWILKKQSARFTD